MQKEVICEKVVVVANEPIDERFIDQVMVVVIICLIIQVIHVNLVEMRHNKKDVCMLIGGIKFQYYD